MDDTDRWLRRIYISEAVSNIGSRMTSVALSYYLFRQTGRGADLGLYYLLLTVPGVIFANPVGRVADKFSRKSLLVYADSTRAAILLFMAFFVPPNQTSWLFPLVFLSQVFRSLYEGAVTPLVSDLTQGEARLAQATANLRIIFHSSFVLGLGVGGFVAFYLKPQYIFMIDAATFIFSAALIRTIPFSKLPSAGYLEVLREMFSSRYYTRWFHLVWEGFQMVREQEYRKTIIGLEFVRDMAYGMFNPIQSLWPQVLFAATKNSLGISLGMIGVGCVGGGFLTNRFISKRLSEKEFFYWLCVFIVTVELLAMTAAYRSSNFMIYILTYLVASGCMNVFEVSTFAKFVSTVADNQKGALVGFFQFVMRLTLSIGMCIYMVMADRLAVRSLPLLPLILLGISIIMLLCQKRSFQSA